MLYKIPNARNITDSLAANEEAEKNVRQFRKEADAYLDRMERDLLSQCDVIKKNNKIIVQATIDDCKTAKNELNGIHAQLTSTEEQSTSLFVKAKKMKPLITEMEHKFVRTDQRLNIQACKFERSSVISDIISSCRALGEIKISNDCHGVSENRKTDVNWMHVQFRQEGSVNVRTSSDDGICLISSIAALDEDTLACADWKNKKVKLIDVNLHVVKEEMSLPSPWDLTCVPDEKLAVTLVSDKQIQFLSYKSCLSKSHAISVSGNCRGIAFNKDRLIVSYKEEQKVEILTLDGKILQCFKTDDTGKALFEHPRYVVISIAANAFYVSDSRKHSVIKISFDGQVLATYKNLLYPKNMIVCKDGSVLVCDSVGNSVHLLSSDCEKLKILLEKKDGVDNCWAVCYSEYTNSLFLSNHDDKNKIKKYKLV